MRDTPKRRAASAQLAQGEYLGIKLQEGDTFLFSSKTIPGNERGVIRIMNMLSEKGVDIVDDQGGTYHVSGHANRPDLQEMHRLIQPQILIPMHGEHRHLREHAKLGETLGLKSVLATNGMMVDLTGNAPRIAEYIDAGRTYIDGEVMVGAMDGVIRDRIRMALNGHVTVTLILDEGDEPLGEPWCEIYGLPESTRSGAGLVEALEEELAGFLDKAGGRLMRDEEKLDRELKAVVRRTARNEIGKKPEVTVVVSRLS